MNYFYSIWLEKVHSGINCICGKTIRVVLCTKKSHKWKTDIFINYLLGKSENDMKRMCAQMDFYLSNFANGAENSIECNFLLWAAIRGIFLSLWVGYLIKIQAEWRLFKIWCLNILDSFLENSFACHFNRKSNMKKLNWQK